VLKILSKIKVDSNVKNPSLLMPIKTKKKEVIVVLLD